MTKFVWCQSDGGDPDNTDLKKKIIRMSHSSGEFRASKYYPTLPKFVIHHHMVIIQWHVPPTKLVWLYLWMIMCFFQFKYFPPCYLIYLSISFVDWYVRQAGRLTLGIQRIGIFRGDTSSTEMGALIPSILNSLEHNNGIKFTGNNIDSHRQWQATGLQTL